ncbi:MAG TPA: hypothetical protein VEQ61_04215 [Thermoleophilaceae bacterium]|nr:hypothetical protein [Thermoleophilaceae bacterium]
MPLSEERASAGGARVRRYALARRVERHERLEQLVLEERARESA